MFSSHREVCNFIIFRKLSASFFIKEELSALDKNVQYDVVYRSLSLMRLLGSLPVFCYVISSRLQAVTVPTSFIFNYV